ncbi:MAG: GNAT family N-acetyltransferase [Caulobacteraceae bacterium]|nr:MAG: GNAT family N-acetyltransferase [Caulobacteraceae bacterium]
MTVRRAVLADAPAIAALYRLSAWHPHIHTPQEDLAFFSERMLPHQTVWVIEDGQGAVAAYAAGVEGWLNHLFVRPDAQGQGHGSRLLDQVRTGAGTLQLWTFQGNTRARGFYERRGFVAVEFTDGEGNEEKIPDVRYEWRR